jgi:hypothetical protein
MIQKKVLNPQRVRQINGGFSFIPHRFVLDGFLAALGQKELLLYLFLVVVSDRNGLSFYSYDSICTLLELNLDEYITSRDSLIKKDLIAFNGTLFQVLELPPKPLSGSAVCRRSKHESPVPIAQLIQQSLKGIGHE